MLTAAGCWRHCGPAAAAAPDPSPSGPRPPQAAAEPLRIQLRFGPKAELDLWVTNPAGEGGRTLDFANPRSNATGGALEADRPGRVRVRSHG